MAAMLLLAGTAVPAAAANQGTVAVVNGIPGERVDICVNGRELRSRVPYGGWASRTISAGDKVLKVFRADPRTCRGTVLAKKPFTLTASPNLGSDLTLVATKKTPKKVITFFNDSMGYIPPDGLPYIYAVWAWRHAADLGDVNFKYRLINPEQPAEPSVAGIWQKGDQFFEGSDPDEGMQLRATRPDQDATLAKSAPVIFAASRRYEWYLLGTTKANAKFVVFSRRVSQFVP